MAIDGASRNPIRCLPAARFDPKALPDRMTDLLAYYLHDLSPHVIRFTDSFAVHWYGLAYVLAFI